MGTPPSEINHVLWQGLPGSYLAAADGGLLKSINYGNNWGNMRPNAEFATSWPAGAVGRKVAYVIGPRQCEFPGILGQIEGTSFGYYQDHIYTCEGVSDVLAIIRVYNSTSFALMSQFSIDMSGFGTGNDAQMGMDSATGKIVVLHRDTTSNLLYFFGRNFDGTITQNWSRNPGFSTFDPGAFAQLRIDGSGNIFANVCANLGANADFQKFDSAGSFLLAFDASAGGQCPGPFDVDISGNSYIAVNGAMTKRGPTGALITTALIGQQGVCAVDRNNNFLYIIDASDFFIKKYDLSFVLVETLGEFPPDLYPSPVDMVIGEDGDHYVLTQDAEDFHMVLLKYDIDGNLVKRSS